jgi:hypothetical protein
MLNENACVIFRNEVKIENELMYKRNPFFKKNEKKIIK